MGAKKYVQIKGAILLPLGLFSLLLGTRLYWLDFGVAVHGRTTIGTAYEKTTTPMRKLGGGTDPDYRVGVSYNTHFGRRVVTSAAVNKALWDSIQEGGQVVLIYTSESPESIVVRNPTRPGLKKLDLGILGLGLLLTLAGTLFILGDRRTR